MSMFKSTMLTKFTISYFPILILINIFKLFQCFTDDAFISTGNIIFGIFFISLIVIFSLAGYSIATNKTWRNKYVTYCLAFISLTFFLAVLSNIYILHGVGLVPTFTNFVGLSLFNLEFWGLVFDFSFIVQLSIFLITLTMLFNWRKV